MKVQSLIVALLFSTVVAHEMPQGMRSLATNDCNENLELYYLCEDDVKAEFDPQLDALGEDDDPCPLLLDRLLGIESCYIGIMEADCETTSRPTIMIHLFGTNCTVPSTEDICAEIGDGTPPLNVTGLCSSESDDNDVATPIAIAAAFVAALGVVAFLYLLRKKRERISSNNIEVRTDENKQLPCQKAL